MTLPTTTETTGTTALPGVQKDPQKIINDAVASISHIADVAGNHTGRSD